MTEENYENPQSKQPVSRPKLEPVTAEYEAGVQTNRSRHLVKMKEIVYRDGFTAPSFA
jgi:hypothetical protein